MVEERGAGQAGGVLDGADRPATVAGLEVVPVAGVGSAQLDHAGAVPARRVATDVSKPPLVADAPAVREERRDPSRGCTAQPDDDRVEVVAQGLARDCRHLVEVDHRAMTSAASGAQQRFAQSHMRQR